MNHAISTHYFINHRLTTSALDKLRTAGISTVEIFCARQHLDYHNQAQIDELAHWFRDTEVKLHSLHSPMYNDDANGRSGPQAIVNIADRVKAKRIAACDEIKRALEIAEQVPFRYLVQHLGAPVDDYDDAKFDAGFASLDELRLFAKHRGVEILLENIPNGLSSAEKLILFQQQTHLDIGFCFDTGHANIMGGVEREFELMKDRIRSLHVHDNDGVRDAHLFPTLAVGGSINWAKVMPLLRSREHQYPLLLELKESLDFPQPLEAFPKIFKKPGVFLAMSALRVRIADIAKHDGQTVSIAGWLYNLRRSGKICFPLLRDGTGIIQCVAVKANLPEELFESLKDLTQESSLIITGKVRAEARAQGGFELDVEGAEILQRVSEADPYPITPKDHGIDFLMDHRHLWLRSRRQTAILRVRHTVIKAIRDYFDNQGFTLVDTPIFTPAACEGTSTLFEVNYFDEEKLYLTQSGQLYNEANAMALGKVYCFGPTFRAEKSKTRRHLTEFWMVEPEMAFATLEDVKTLAEGLVVYCVGRVLEDRRAELEVLERDVKKLESVQAPFPRMSYDDAVKILNGKGSEITWGGDFGNTDETLLTQDFDRPVMVDRYPSEIKAFYFQPDENNDKLALGVDVLAPEGYGEIIGGGQRIHDPELLLRRLKEHDLPPEAFNWYMDLRKYGTVPHGGFGMGVERFVAWMCGTEHIRECIAYPRMLYRTRP